jgi:multiple sugar transport system ATP-binding protein|tara:strand:- start:1984 stop:3243 length:1260 start_codon:yes stop_codon:yes gene_type:complete
MTKKRNERPLPFPSKGLPMASIKLSKISKNFADTNVLKNIDFDICDGEFLTLVGPSGCGKSTLLRIIAGLEVQSQGDVLISGSVVNSIRASQRDLAMVFQSYALYPHLTVRRNIETPLRLRDLSFWERLPLLGNLIPGRSEKIKLIFNDVEEVSNTLKIGELMNRKPGQLSGGQRQRVALGRAMVRKPRAFLMDEPLSNLDAALRVHMRSELAELHRSLGTTFIYVTHDQAEALTMSDRMAVMMDGEILQLGAPDEIYANPMDQRVAEFVGSPKINLLPADVTTRGDICFMDRRVPGLSIASPGPIMMGVRPEHVLISDPIGNGIEMKCEVFHIENLGSHFYLHCILSGTEYRLIVRASPKQAAEISIGSSISIFINSDHLIYFGSNKIRIFPSQSEQLTPKIQDNIKCDPKVQPAIGL